MRFGRVPRGPPHAHLSVRQGRGTRRRAGGSCRLHDRRRAAAAGRESAGQNAVGAPAPPTRFGPGNLRHAGGHAIFRRMESTVPKAAAPWLLFADGAARGNPGPAAGGYVLDDADGRERARGAVVLGATTNNVAEYKALLAGLARALELGVEAIEVRMDSELVVRQMCGVYRVRNEGLKPLFAEAQALSRRFARFRIQHVPRDQNSRADAEANRALDALRA